MINKDDFNKVWKKSTKEAILNQFYYEHKALYEAMNFIMQNADYDKQENRCYKSIEPYEAEILLEILEGNNE